MRIAQIFILIGFLQTIAFNAYSQGITLTLNFSDTELFHIFEQIENETGFYFLYDENLVDDKQKTSINIKNQELNEVLSELFTSTDIRFTIIDKKILLSPIDNTDGQPYPESGKTITGTITDENGQKLPGASVSIKGTAIGTISDINGNFSITNSPENAVLVFTFLGKETQEIAFSNQSSLTISLPESTFGLEEVVTVGYGTQSKKTVSGSIQTVSSSDLSEIPVAQFTQALQGKVAGVQINQSSGIPGQGIQIRVRGAGSILAGNKPLYVIDGFPISGDLRNINTDEIESISILKDAASSAMYGSRAANGVVLITTKQARKAMDVSFNAYYGAQNLPQKGRPDMMNGTEFAQFKKEYFEDLGQEVPEIFQNPEKYGEGNDWYDILFHVAPIENYTLSMSSKSDRLGGQIVAGYLNQNGILINSGFKRYSFRTNTLYEVNNHLSLGFNVSTSYSSLNSMSTGNPFFQENLLALALQTWPIFSYKREDGSLPLTAWIPDLGGFPSPNYYRAAQEIKTTTTNLQLLSNAYVQLELLKDLTVKSSINIEYGISNMKFFNPSTSSISFAISPPVIASARLSNGSSSSWLFENTATYIKSLGKHNIEILVGYTTQEFGDKTMSIYAKNFPDDRISDIDTAVTIENDGTDTGEERWSMISYLTRLNYDYMGKYILQATIRRDGSSRFGKNNLWGNFPSVSAAWNISDENWYPGSKLVNALKLRASYGLTGNNNIGNYTHLVNVGLDEKAVFGSTIESSSYVENIGNSNLGWEKTTQWDIGADISFLNNRLSLTYDYYLKNTSGLLYELGIAPSTGYNFYMSNTGQLRFWGHELALMSYNSVGEFKWNSQINLTFNDNRVISIAPDIDAIYNSGHVTKVGERIGLFWGLIHDGVYDNQEEFDNSPKATPSNVGTVKFKDVNSDGKISNQNLNGDRTIIGDPTPDFLIGINNSFSYKAWDLSITTSGSIGQDIANRFEQGATNLDGAFNILSEVKDRWRSEENPGSGKYGTTTTATYMERDWFNSRFIHDGSFLTIKNITLGYNFPLRKTGIISELRLYASIQQVYTFTNYNGNNPEVSNYESVLQLGDDYSSYPVPRTYSFGINISM